MVKTHCRATYIGVARSAMVDNDFRWKSLPRYTVAPSQLDWRDKHNLRKIIFFHTISEDDFYMKIVDIGDIYSFLFLSFFSLRSL
jgi:outer membrane protease